MIRAQAKIVEAWNGHLLPHPRRAEVLDGEYRGIKFCLDGRDGREPLGTEVTVEFHPEDQFAKVVRS